MEQIEEKFKIDKDSFLSKEELKGGEEIIKKITETINELVANFNAFNGSELAEIQTRLAGYKFYLADCASTLMNKAEYWKSWIKDEKARRWPEVVDWIKETEGKVKNKEQVENTIQLQLTDIINEQIFYESEFYRYKMKSFALDDLLTAIVQQIASRKRELEQIKSMQ
jgi:hypothetical protein